MRMVSLGLVLAVALAGPALGQEAANQETELALEIKALNSTLESIRKVLLQQLETQNLELLMRRSDLASREAAEIERQLRAAKALRLEIAEEEKRTRNRFEMMLAQMQELDESEAELFAAQMEQELSLMDARAKALDSEIGELEGRQSQKRGELRDWQDLLDRRLRGR